jgi:signal transduction histidine kinase
MSQAQTSQAQTDLTPRERELGAIILQYNEVTERLKSSYEQLLTEAERLREELEHKNRELERRERLAALGQMAAGLAHEIRNPLGGIQLYASLLARDMSDSPEQLDVLQKIGRGVRLIDGLVTDVLTFAKPSDPQKADVCFGAVLDEVIELMVARLQRVQVDLRIDPTCRDLSLWADPKQLKQVLSNVLFNALEALEADQVNADEGQLPWVAVSAEVDGETGQDALITIADSGPGIDSDALHRVFNPFFTTKDSGTGLGLAIVHQLVEAHGGSITAGRDGQRGAVFSIRLPLRQTTVDASKTSRSSTVSELGE